MKPRLIQLPKKIDDSMFIWGPRQTGKSSLMRMLYPDLLQIDLLKSDEYRRYKTNPEVLRSELIPMPPSTTVIIDEIQMVPELLNEVHWLIENKGINFVLCGSIARKLKRSHANMLGGRALRFELLGFVAGELGDDFNLTRMLNHGYLPRHYLAEAPTARIEAYVANYLKEEIAAEGAVKNLPAFSNFLNISSLSDTEIVNYSTVAREVGGVSSETVKAYFEILSDTLLGSWLPAFQKRPKRRILHTPKFYFFDVGIVNYLARRKNIEPGSELFGKAFENWLFHELRGYLLYKKRNLDITYWKLTTGKEVDFIIGDANCAIEAKASANVHSDHLNGLREFKNDHPECSSRFVVSLDLKARQTEDGIIILPYKNFLTELWADRIF